jgi:hypothetical protein
LRDAITRNGVTLISEPTLDESIARRIAIFDETAAPEGVKAFVNIGGGSANIGTRLSGRLIPAGVNRTLRPYNWTIRAVLHHYAGRGVPVIHMLGIESIALAHEFPVAPDFIPAVGEGAIFYREVYDLRVVVPAFLVFLVLCFGVLRAYHRAALTAREESAAAGTGSLAFGAGRKVEGRPEEVVRSESLADAGTPPTGTPGAGEPIATRRSGG